tara:strand:+ start:391 stop:885 length:495 start_codon:yes stop_codon:yes gene_type:complete
MVLVKNLMTSKTLQLPEIAFIVYAILVIATLEMYKEHEAPDTERFTELDSALQNDSLVGASVTPPPKVSVSKEVTQTNVVGPPPLGYLDRFEWSQVHYGGQSPTPIPGTDRMDPIEISYSQTTTLTLANPFIREEACLPIEGNIGMKIDRAHEIFGPFVREFVI